MAKLSVEEVSDAVEASTLSAAILEGVSPDDIASASLSRKWRKAKALLEEIQEILDDEYDASEDEDDEEDGPDDDEDDESEMEYDVDDD